MIVLSVLSGGCRGHVASYEPPVMVGRNPGNDLQLSVDLDLTVSGRHAEIRLADGVFRLHDLGSSNGTLLNGQKISMADLKDGDVIQFGLNGPTVQFGVRPEKPEARTIAEVFFCAICAAHSSSRSVVCPSCSRTLCEIHRIPQYGICNDCVARGYKEKARQPGGLAGQWQAPTPGGSSPAAVPRPAPVAPGPPPQVQLPPPPKAAPPAAPPAAAAARPVILPPQARPLPPAAGAPKPGPLRRLPTMGMMLTPETARIGIDDPAPPMPPPLPVASGLPEPVYSAPPPPPETEPGKRRSRKRKSTRKGKKPMPSASSARLPPMEARISREDAEDEAGFFTEDDFRTTLSEKQQKRPPPDFEMRL